MTLSWMKILNMISLIFNLAYILNPNTYITYLLCESTFFFLITLMIDLRCVRVVVVIFSV